MAQLQVIRFPTSGIDSDEVVIHGQTVGANGVVEVDGECGDRTIHPLRYTVRGSPGASWYLRILCGSDLIYLGDVEIGPTGHFESGPRELKLSPVEPKKRERAEGTRHDVTGAQSGATSAFRAAAAPYTLKVEANDAVLTCALFLDEVPIVDFNEDGEAPLELTPGEHFFYYDVRGSGAKVSIDLSGGAQPRIIEPEGEWPFEVTVPADRQGRADRFYILVEG